MKIVTLIENIVYRKDLKAEHGLSFLIKTENRHILFDTGQSGEFIENASKMGEDLSLVDTVILSHGHYDHAGGLSAFLNMNQHAKLYMKRPALETKYSKSSGEIRSIGIPSDLTPFMHRICFVDEAVELDSSMVILGNIERTTSYETENSKLLIEQSGNYTPDPFNDELVLYIKQNNELTIVSGCSHRGMINTINSIMAHSGLNSIRLFIGGTHLNGAPSHRLEATTQALAEMKIQQLMPNHCTGIQAYIHLEKNLTAMTLYASTGTIVTIN